MNEPATIPQLKTEIQFYERQTATGMLEIGKRLIQIKGQLPHGEFGTWCETELNYDQRTANRFMKSFEEYGNSTSMSNLNPTQMIAMLGLPEEQKQEIVQNNDMSEMTVKKLRDEVKNLKDKTRQYEEGSKNLTDQRDSLVRQLQNVKPEVVVKEVVKTPVDYENTKLELDRWRKAYNSVYKTHEELSNENRLLREQNKDKTYYKGLDVGVYISYMRSFIADMKKYEVMKDDFANLNDEDAQKITTWINRVQDQMTVMKMLKNKMEVTIIE